MRSALASAPIRSMPAQLRFAYERDLVALPTMTAVLASPGFWMRDRADLGIDYTKLVHGEQSVELHAPLAGRRRAGRPQPRDSHRRQGGRQGLRDACRKDADRRCRRADRDHRAGTVPARRRRLFGRAAGQRRRRRPRRCPRRRRVRPSSSSTCRRGPMRRCCTGSRGTSIRCTPIRHSPRAPVSRVRSCMAWRLMASPAMASSRPFATMTRRGFGDSGTSVPRRWFPARRSRLEAWRVNDHEIAFRGRIVERDVVVLTNGRARL